MPDSSAGSRSLRELLDKVIPVEPDADQAIRGLAAHSAHVRPGYAFVAIEGTAEDGHDFIGDAIDRGAAVIISEHAVSKQSVPVIQVENARNVLAHLAAEWYGNPADELILVGITGTLGKTSVLTFLEAILNTADLRAGAIGSEIIGIRFGDELELKTPHTTPDPLRLHHGLRRLIEEGAETVCMEVTSHALDQGRVHGLNFAAGVFTNLVPLEHQDYHGSFEDYVDVKLRFCEALGEGAPLVYGADSPLLTSKLSKDSHRLIGCGFDEDADVVISDVRMGLNGSSYRLRVGRSLRQVTGDEISPMEIAVEMPLLGTPHILNSAFAAVAALCVGACDDSIREGLANFTPPHRRMELLRIGGFLVLDDTSGHPRSVESVFNVAGHLPHQGLHVVTAIRGSRGTQINSRLAGALAAGLGKEYPGTVHTTDSADTVDELNVVTDDERAAYLDGLKEHDVPFSHFENLRDALSTAISQIGEGDLLVLIGAQGMISGADLLRRFVDDPDAAV